MTCEKCMHWRYGDENYEGGHQYGQEYGVCAKISDAAYTESPMALTEFGYQVITRRDFGCKLFEAKEATSDSSA